MITEKALKLPFSLALRSKLYDYGLLVKFKLNITVVFSTMMGFIIGSSGTFKWFDLLVITLGGFLTVGAANGLNQIIERDSDMLMKRTSNRPVATHRMSVQEAAIACTLMGIVGVLLIGIHLNKLSGILSFGSLCIYAFLYTPLKSIHPIAVYVGAIPGALPPIIGYVAAKGSLDALGISLFVIQFLWQFPHFYAIAWLLDDDYKRAGIKLMPLGTVKGKKAAIQILIFCGLLIPCSFLPYWVGGAHLLTCILLAICALAFCRSAYKLLVSLDKADAKKLMFASIIYLPVSFLVLLIEKLY